MARPTSCVVVIAIVVVLVKVVSLEMKARDTAAACARALICAAVEPRALAGGSFSLSPGELSVGTTNPTVRGPPVGTIQNHKSHL